MRLASVVLIALAAAGAAPARPAAGCHMGDPRLLHCLEPAMRLERAARFRDRGETLIRIVTLPVLAPPETIDIVLPKSGPGRLVGRLGYGPEQTRTYVFSRERFAELRNRLNALTGAGAILHGGKPRPESEKRGWEDSPCARSRDDWAEAALDGRDAVADLSYCLTDDNQFVGAVEAFALSLDPDCAGARPDEEYEIPPFAICLGLSGDDRRLAAAVHFASFQLMQALSDQRTAGMAATLIGPDARLQFSGGPPLIGGAAIVAKLRAERNEPNFGLYGAHAQAGRVTVRGRVCQEFDQGSDERWFCAPDVKTWHRGVDGKLLLVDWQVGAFEAL